MLKYRLKYFRKNSLIIFSLLCFISCNYERNESPTKLINKFKLLSKSKQSSLSFGYDTLYLSENEVNQGGAFFYGRNNSQIPLTISMVIASANCQLVTYSKKYILPYDSLRVHIMISDSLPNHMFALIFVGNLVDGQKTIFIKKK